MKQVFLMTFVGLAVLARVSNLYAQDDDEKFRLSVDVASGFVWRGFSLNTSPVVQPTITFTQGRFSIGAWATTPFNSGEYQEIDVFASYQITQSLSISITDYFDYTSFFWGKDYFNYKKNETFHAFDLQLMHCGSEDYPFKAMISTIIGGDDLNDEGKSNFSTYFELGYGNTTKRGINWEVFTGFVPMKSYFYEITDASIVNIGFGVSKSLEITPTYSLPLSFSFSINPAYRSVYFVAKITLL